MKFTKGYSEIRNREKMSNSSISTRFQWDITLNQHDSDTDSTDSDLDILSQSIFKHTLQEPDLSKENSSKKSLLGEINSNNFQARKFNFEKNCYEEHKDLLCTNFENNTCLTEIVGRSWTETNKENSKFNEEEIKKDDKLTLQIEEQCIDKNVNAVESMINKTDDIQWTTESNFESNTCLTDIIDKSWSEEIHENVVCNERKPDGKLAQKMISSKPCLDKKSNISTFFENNEIEFCLTKIVDEEWRKGLEKNNSKSESTLGEFTQKVVEDISSLLFDDKGAKQDAEGNFNVSDQGLSVFNRYPSETNFEQSKNMSSMDDVLESDLLEAKSNMDIDFSECSPDDVTKISFTQNNAYLEGLTLNLENINAEKIFNDNYHDIHGKNSMKSNDRFIDSQEKKVHIIPRNKFKPKVFPAPLFSKIHGVPPRDQVPKRNCALKNLNLYIKPKTSNKENEFNPPKKTKKAKLVSANKVLSDYSARKTKSFCKTPGKRNTKHKTNLEEQKNIEYLVKIGAKLDKIRTCISKWLNGDPETAVSREKAVNMLGYVKHIQSYLKTVYGQNERKPSPIKKILGAASILELRIGKAISDADLLYKTEQLNRLMMLKYEDEIESDDCSNVVLQSQNGECYSNNSKAEIGKIQNRASYYCEDMEINKRLEKLTVDATSNNETLPTTNNLKSILKNAGKYDSTEKKILNFSDNVEYFNISQEQENKKANMQSNMGINVLKYNEENVINSNIRYDFSFLNSGNTESGSNSLQSLFQYLNLSQDNAVSVSKVCDSRVENILNSSHVDYGKSSSIEKECSSNTRPMIEINSSQLESNSSQTPYSNQGAEKNLNLENVGTNRTLTSKRKEFFNNGPQTNQLSSKFVTEQNLSSHNNQENVKQFSINQIKANENISTNLESIETNYSEITKNINISKGDNLSYNVRQNEEPFSFKLKLDPTKICTGEQNSCSHKTVNNLEFSLNSDSLEDSTFQQNNSALLIYRTDNTESVSFKPENMSSKISALNQNNTSVLKDKCFSNSILENTDSRALNLESMCSEMSFSLPSYSSSVQARSVDYSSKPFSINFSETEESWQQITIMGIKLVRIKSASEYNLVTGDEDCLSDY